MNSFCCVAVLTLFSRTKDFESLLLVGLEGTTCLFLIGLLAYCFVKTLLLYIIRCDNDMLAESGLKCFLNNEPFFLLFRFLLLYKATLLMIL